MCARIFFFLNFFFIFFYFFFKARDRDLLQGKLSSHLWLIHGKLYDLAPYLDKHPGSFILMNYIDKFLKGGRQWLLWTQGSDCTTEVQIK